jgi:hypothetical protein
MSPETPGKNYLDTEKLTEKKPNLKSTPNYEQKAKIQAAVHSSTTKPDKSPLRKRTRK